MDAENAAVYSGSFKSGKKLSRFVLADGSNCNKQLQQNYTHT